jgi:hypothetical protein
MYKEWKKIEFPKEYCNYMNLESTRTRGRPRNRWQDEVKEDGRIVGGEEWQERIHDRHGIVAFCTCQWNGREEVNNLLCPPSLTYLCMCLYAIHTDCSG